MRLPRPLRHLQHSYEFPTHLIRKILYYPEGASLWRKLYTPLIYTLTGHFPDLLLSVPTPHLPRDQPFGITN